MVKSRRTAVPVVPPPITTAVYLGMLIPAFNWLRYCKHIQTLIGNRNHKYFTLDYKALTISFNTLKSSWGLYTLSKSSSRSLQTLLSISISHAVNHSFWILVPALSPMILEEFKLTYVEAGIVFSVFLATYAVGQIPVGALAGRFNPAKLMGFGLLLSAIGMLLTATAPNYYAILAFQAFAGLGGSAHHPLSLHL
ncbi:TPA: MFS transporter, partial [Candidatus Bathyarchaeota archaeon]|nr:MFS transporter [Candidatus Bathyarchaeota archaeon]